MGRPSNREERRAQFLEAFARVLAKNGVEGATVTRVAAEVGVAPGLLHHHFASKEEMTEALLSRLIARFRERAHEVDELDRVVAYGVAALSLGRGSDPTAARAWVGVLAEALRRPALFGRVRRLLDVEMASIREHSGWELTEDDAAAILAFILGALVFGAFAPRRAAGFAAPALVSLVRALRARGSR